MDVAVFAVILIGLAAFVAAPLYSYGHSSGSARAPQDLPDVASRHGALLTALRDLEVDRVSGLLDEAGYQRERTALEAEAAGFVDTPEHPPLD